MGVKKILPDELRWLEKDKGISGMDVFMLLDMEKWAFRTPDEKDLCDKYLVDLYNKYGEGWIKENRYKIVNDFEDMMGKRREKQEADKKRKKKKGFLKQLFSGKGMSRV